MSEEAIYIISNSGPDSYDPRYVIGPKVPDWEAYCKSLAEETAAEAIKANSKGNQSRYDYVNDHDRTIDDSDLTSSLLTILLTKGYREINFPKYDFGWRGEEDEDYPYPSVRLFNLQCEIHHNEEWAETWMKDHPEDKSHLGYLKEEILEKAERIRKLGGTPIVNTELMAKLDRLSENRA